jgi:hypothetical protein
MKKTICILQLLLCISFFVSGQDSRREAADLVLLLDVSAGMSDYYQDLKSYLTGPFIRNNLRPGDTFHLISFSDRARLEISRRIEGQNDLDVITGRMFLTYPLERHADIAAALSYTETYTASLPTARNKRVILISDGRRTGGDTEALLANAKSRLSRRGIAFDYIRFPQNRVTPPVAPEPKPVSPTAPTSPAPPAPQVPPPKPAVTEEPVPVEPEPPEPTPEPETPGYTPIPLPRPLLPLWSGRATPLAPWARTLARRSLLPLVPPKPTASSAPALPEPLPTVSEEPQEVLPEIPVQPEAPPVEVNGFPPLVLLAGAEAALLLIVLLGSVRLRQRLNLSWKKTREDQGQKTSGQFLSLHVQDQSAAPGWRNIHILKPGHALTVGGGDSDFLIFIVPLQARIARVRFDGASYTFIPLKARFFPDIGSQPVPDCIGKTIRILTERNYELHIRIDLYENPRGSLFPGSMGH